MKGDDMGKRAFLSRWEGIRLSLEFMCSGLVLSSPLANVAKPASTLDYGTVGVSNYNFSDSKDYNFLYLWKLRIPHAKDLLIVRLHGNVPLIIHLTGCYR